MKKFPNVWISTKWTKAFFVSHICGWIIATLQTLWIIWVVERRHRQVMKAIKRKQG